MSMWLAFGASVLCAEIARARAAYRSSRIRRATEEGAFEGTWLCLRQVKSLSRRTPFGGKTTIYRGRGPLARRGRCAGVVPTTPWSLERPGLPHLAHNQRWGNRSPPRGAGHVASYLSTDLKSHRPAASPIHTRPGSQIQTHVGAGTRTLLGPRAPASRRRALRGAAQGGADVVSRFPLLAPEARCGALRTLGQGEDHGHYLGVNLEWRVSCSSCS